MDGFDTAHRDDGARYCSAAPTAMKVAISLVAATVVLAASGLAGFFLYSPVVSRKSLQDCRVREADRQGNPTVTVDGRLLGGMMVVRTATRYQQGRNIVLVVRAGITRPGLRAATFHYEIPVPSDVNEISFGNAEDVVWRRKGAGPTAHEQRVGWFDAG